ncbi:MAG: glycosyltransferase family 2 protein [Selenomonadaceae bacterium]|nr:glycosyltransferase family 2 protein [Selenomonadaceae bacterium]
MDEILFENEVALVLIVKNESRYIKEWLEYHYRIGVDKFYIYDNDSEDRSELLKILDPWIQSGIVDLESVAGVRRQMPVYNDAIEKHRFDCRWMGFIDTDEFIYIKTRQNLPEFLNEHFQSKYGIAGLGINWMMFGTNGKKSYEPIDVIERFTRRAPDNHPEHLQIKTIANPRMILYIESPHHARYLMGVGCFDENSRLILEHESDTISHEKIQVNHYFQKSYEEFIKKISRGRADIGIYRDLDSELRSFLNEVEDLGLRDFWQQIKSQPLRKPIDHSSKKVLSNVREMLTPFLSKNTPSEILQGQIEKLLTCLFLVRKSDLLNESDKKNLEEVILNLLMRTLRETGFDISQAMLILSLRNNILETKFQVATDVIELMFSQIPKLIEIAEDATQHFQKFYLQQIQRDLSLILN